MRKLGNIAASTRLAFALIGILLVLMLLSALIPQKGFAEEQVVNLEDVLGGSYVLVEKLGLDRIYFTPFFFVVLSLLGINLIAGNVKRFKTVYRIERTLLRARHLGSIVFHLALVLVIGSVIMNYLYKFHGVYGLTEGQAARDNPGEYFRILAGPLWTSDFERFQVTLDEVDPTHEVEGATTQAALISVRAPGSREITSGTVMINQPLRWNGLEFHLGSRIGYSPELVVTDTDEATLFKGFVRLATRREAGAFVYQDYVFLPGGTRIGMEIVPDDQEATTRLITVEQDGDVLYEGPLAEGEVIQAAGLSIEIPRMRQWCYIDVVRSPFLNFVFVAFWLGLAGMTMGFIPRVVGSGRKSA